MTSVNCLLPDDEAGLVFNYSFPLFQHYKQQKAELCLSSDLRSKQVLVTIRLMNKNPKST